MRIAVGMDVPGSTYYTFSRRAPATRLVGLEPATTQVRGHTTKRPELRSRSGDPARGVFAFSGRQAGMKRGQILRRGQYITLHAARLKLGWSYPQALRRVLTRVLRAKRIQGRLFVHVADVQRLLDGAR